MSYFKLLLIVASLFVVTSAFADSSDVKTIAIESSLRQLEHKFHHKLGVYSIDTNNNQIIAYRANDHFPLASTSKLMAVADVLKLNLSKRKFLQKNIAYTKKDLVEWSPITKQFVNKGMTIAQLSATAIAYSDNTAMNLLMKNIGGPKALTAFSRSIGNESFNLVDYEPNLNSNPKSKIDSSSPRDMALSLEKLAYGNILTNDNQKLLIGWMKSNTTGDSRIRAGVPPDWVVADKTGSGGYGVANDIGIILPPGCKPIILAIYTTGDKPEAIQSDEMLASIAMAIVDRFSRDDLCVKVRLKCFGST